ncbi:MAG: hypothetical protein WDM90_20260 [Ferruginibacter sp.]
MQMNGFANTMATAWLRNFLAAIFASQEFSFILVEIVCKTEV